MTIPGLLLPSLVGTVYQEILQTKLMKKYLPTFTNLEIWELPKSVRQTKKSCSCQGEAGASYSFGCSWTMFGNVCKFCRSKPGNVVRKFKLTNKRNETVEVHLSNICEELTNCVAPVYAKLAPDSFKNMAVFDTVATDCRIGAPGNRIFSGLPVYVIVVLKLTRTQTTCFEEPQLLSQC